MSIIKPDRSVTDNERGKISTSHNGQGKGIAYENGINILKSRADNETFFGTKRDDISLCNKFNDKSGSEEPFKKNIYSRDGYDTVILHGVREDYDIEIPTGAHAYPLGSKEDTNIKYGDNLRLIDKEGNIFNITGVERIVFDNNGDYQKPKQIIQNLESDIRDGKVEAVSTRELIKVTEASLTEEELIEAKLCSTPEFADVMRKYGDLERSEHLDEALEAARKANPDILSFEPDYSASTPYSQDTIPVQENTQAPVMKLPGLED